ncbi:hypothetical protein KJ840_00335 [Patescibacteria group bacterium]|nr:hypothetical protein [Patescibacteria group bacterium]
MKSPIKLIISLLFITLVLSGCLINVKTTGGGFSDGGVFVSGNSGDDWQQISLIYRVSDVEKTFSNVDLTAMVMDPLDNKAIYIATHDQGLFYTYDAGAGWHQTLQDKGRINALAISPSESCIIYAAISNRVYKSVDCNRHWDYKLIESRADPDNQITSLAIDNYNTNVIYAGTSGKGLFRSDDGGYSWHVVKFFNDRVDKVLILPANNQVIYVVTASQGIFKTADQGESWLEVFDEAMKKEYGNLLTYRDLILDPTVEDGLFYACNYGLFRSADGGAAWKNIDLLTPPNTAVIYSLAINPQNGQEIYYGIDTLLYRSEDGGANWITRTLPTSRAAKYLIADPRQSARVYLGVKKIK